jgi:hypothetical protein
MFIAELSQTSSISVHERATNDKQTERRTLHYVQAYKDASRRKERESSHSFGLGTGAWMHEGREWQHRFILPIGQRKGIYINKAPFKFAPYYPLPFSCIVRSFNSITKLYRSAFNTEQEPFQIMNTSIFLTYLP